MNISSSKSFKLFLSCALVTTLALPLSLSIPKNEVNAEESTQEKLDNAQAKLDEVNKQLEQLQKEFEEVNAKLASTTKEIEVVNGQIDVQQEKLKEKQGELGNRVAIKYRSGDSNLLDLILSSTSFSDFANNWFLANKVMQSDNDLIDGVKEEKQKLSDQKTELENLQSQQQQQIQSVQAKQQETTDLVNSLDQEVKDLMAQREAEIVAAAATAAAAQAAANQASAGGSVYQGSAQVPHADTAQGQAIVNACFSTPSPGAGYCAMWVSQVYSNAGCGYPQGNANDMYWAYCHSSDKSEIQAGMIIAVPSHTAADSWGVIYGHVGIYIGNGQVMHNIGSISTTSLDSWISTFGTTYPVKWGWA